MNTLSGYSKSTLTDKYVLTAAGGHLAVGNADKNIPINNGTVNTNLNADLLDGLHLLDILDKVGYMKRVTYVNSASGFNLTNPFWVKVATINKWSGTNSTKIRFDIEAQGGSDSPQCTSFSIMRSYNKVGVDNYRGVYITQHVSTTYSTDNGNFNRVIVDNSNNVWLYYGHVWPNLTFNIIITAKANFSDFTLLSLTLALATITTTVPTPATSTSDLTFNFEYTVFKSLQGNATANKITAIGGFYKLNSNNSYVLLGGGGHKALSDFSMSHSHPYLPLAGGTMNQDAVVKFNLYGNRLLTISGNSLDFDYSTCTGGWSGGIFLNDSQNTEIPILGWYGGINGISRTTLNGGNIGIGTASPKAKLSVYAYSSSEPAAGSLGTTGTVEFGSGNYGTYFWTMGSGKGYIQQGRTDGTATSYDLILQKLGGNIGIGVDSPENKLDVNGVLQVYIRGVRNNAFDNLLLLKLQNSSEPSGDSWDESYPSFGIGFRRYWTSGTSPYGETTCAGIYATVSASWKGGLVFRTKNNTTNGGTHDVTALRLSPSGQLYIIKPINTNLTTSTHLAGNQGTAIINSTATAGSYTMLAKMNSNNGYFTHGTYKDGYTLYYTAKSTVDAGTNTITKTATLLNEDGDSVLSGYANAAGFKRSGSDNTYVLLGGGSHKAISDFLPSGNYAGSDTSGGKAYYSYKLYYASTATLSTKAAIDGFLEAYTFKALLWNGSNAEDNLSTSYPGTGNGTILSGGYSSTSYGFLLAIDDDPNWFMALRQRGNGTWAAWKRIPMGDGTGASGTWSINITGNADSSTVTKRFKLLLTGSATTSKDLNTALSGGGIAANYAYPMSHASGFTNAPSGSLYGCVLLFSQVSDSLNGLLAWDVNHRGTDSTRYLWWRANDDTGFANAKWHQIAFTDTKVLNASNADVATKLARAEYLESDDAINGFLEANRFKFALFKTTALNQIGMGSYDGMLLSIPWGSTDYGFQMAFDDSTNCVIKARGKAVSWGTWRTLYHTGNLTKVSQLTNDSGYLTSRGYIGTTAVLASSASLDLTGIGWINGGIRLNKANDDCGRMQGLGHGLEFGGPGYAHMNYYFRPHYGTSGSTLTNVYIQNASADSAPTFTTTHSFSSAGNASHSGTVTSTGFIKSGSSNSYVLLGGGGHKTESSLSVSYAASAGNADTLDGLNSDAFMRATKANSYYGIQHPDGGTSDWTRTTSSGIIPYLSGGASALGTSSWPFNNIYGTNIYGSVIGGKLTATAGGAGSTSISYANAAIMIGTVNRSGTAGSYYPGIAFNHMYTYSSGTSYRNHAHAWIGLKLHSTPAAELSYLIFATNSDSTNGTSPIERMSIAPNGTVKVNNDLYAAHFYENSDKQLKTNIQEILNSDKMPIIKEFDWKESNSHSYGLIAQELEEQGYSELVSVKDDGYKTVNYSAALSLIVGKLQVKIKELEKEIENLKNKN